MQRKLFTLFAGLVLLSLMIAPLGTANAQGPTPPPPPSTSKPPFPGGKGPIGAQRAANGRWFMPEGAHAMAPDHAVVPLASGGPDNFGYTWDDSVALSWIDTTSGTNTGLTGYDDATGPISLPFPFKYYENTYSQVYIAASGYLGFTDYGYWDSQSDIPSVTEPNNVIAPYWTPTYIGAGSWVHYMSGGSAPNRYFVMEWHDVKGGAPGDIGQNDTYRFEVILHENGDIVFQYQTMTYGSDYWCGASGIEDSTGLDGLTYVGFCNLAPSNKAVRFYRPPVSARVRLTPTQQGRFTQAGAAESFQIDVRNTGELGTDTYDLTAVSLWPVTFYAADGVTPLTDTDGDFIVDTGSVAQGSPVTITVKFATPAGATEGDANTATITAVSSLNTSKSKTATLQTAIPAPFAQVYDDYADGAMSLELVQPNAQVVKKATADGYYGDNMAVTAAPNGNFVYLWNKGRSVGSVYVREIEYTLLDHYGNTVRAVSKLTDHSGATMYTYDYSPSVAVAPNGSMGVAWYRYLYNSATSQFNYNIYFATLDVSGNVVYGPANITTNNVWGTGGSLNVPSFYNPRITATGDNRFVLTWQRQHQEAAGYVDDIYYATRNTSGAEVKAITKITNDSPGASAYYQSALTSLSSSRAFLSWISRSSGNDDIYYAIVDSEGNLVKTATDLSVDETVTDWRNYDAVQLSDGKIFVAWEAWGCFAGEWVPRIRFALLDTSYNRIGTPTCLGKAAAATSGDTSASVTTDMAGHAILTWMDNDERNNLYYALVNSSGTVLTPAMIFHTSQDLTYPYIETSYNGQGNVPYTKFGDVPPDYWAASWIERLANAGITGGCGTGIYCPDSTVTRAQMAVFLLKGMHGSSYAPPAVGADSGFSDVPVDYWAAAWIKQLAAEGITGGCGAGIYCPDATVTRAQMAVFLLKAEHGLSYSPPSATGVFTDVPVGYWADKWIEQLASEGITGGCGSGNYCPDAAVTRAQMAVFLVIAFNLP